MLPCLKEHLCNFISCHTISLELIMLSIYPVKIQKRIFHKIWSSLDSDHENTVFFSVAPFGLTEVWQHFRELTFPFHKFINTAEKLPSKGGILFLLPWRGTEHVSLKHCQMSTRLHGVLSKSIILQKLRDFQKPIQL